MHTTRFAALMTVLFTCLGIVSGGNHTSVEASKVHVVTPVQSPPTILNARRKGKKLILEGENFNIGAVIMVNGKEQKTRNDDSQPNTILIAMKAGKKISLNEVVEIQVQNPGTAPSDIFEFFAGRTITLDDAGRTVELSVGERFLVLLKKTSFEWRLTIEDPTFLKEIKDVPPVAGSQGIFEALRAGSTTLAAEGLLPCHKLTPPCLAPSLGFEVRLVVR